MAGVVKAGCAGSHVDRPNLYRGGGLVEISLQNIIPGSAAYGLKTVLVPDAMKPPDGLYHLCFVSGKLRVVAQV